MQGGFAGIRWKYAFLAGIAGAITSMVLVALLYMAANPILFNPAYQSAKVIAVYQSIQPLPLLTSNPAALALGWIVVSMVRTLVFAWLYKGIPGTGIRKGIAWGIAVWLTVIFFSEFYTAINLLGEPFYLVVFEAFLILWPFLGEGSVVATIYRRAWPAQVTPRDIREGAKNPSRDTPRQFILEAVPQGFRG